jgi:hypothetical protein
LLAKLVTGHGHGGGANLQKTRSGCKNLTEHEPIRRR